MSRKNSKTRLPAVFNIDKAQPAIFGQFGVVGSLSISVYALDSAFNQGLATGSLQLDEKTRKLPLATVQAAVPPDLKRNCRSVVSEHGRFSPYPILFKHAEGQSLYVLVAGADLVDAAAAAGAKYIDCVVIPYDKALTISRALIDDVETPPNGQLTLNATMPAAENLLQSYCGKDDTEQPLETEQASPKVKARLKKRSRTGSPAVSQAGIKHGLDPRANLLLHLAAHSTTVVDGEVVVRAVEASNSATTNRLSAGDQEGLDILIEYVSREAGAAGISLHEFALTLLLYRLFQHVKETVPTNDRRRAGHGLVKDKRDKDHWPGSPNSFQNWVETRKNLCECKNEFWSGAIPNDLFERCVALRYGVAEPTPDQLQSYLFQIIQAAFKMLDLAGRQTSNLRDLHRANHTSKPRPIPRRVVNQAVDGVSNPSIGASHQVNEVDRFMLAVLGRVNAARVWRDKAHQTLMFQWLVAIGDFSRTGKMIVTCLMAQELILVDRERRMNRSIDAGWIVFDAILALVVKERCGWNKVHRELVSLCEDAMRGSHGMIVSRAKWGSTVLVATPMNEATSRAAETPILLF